MEQIKRIMRDTADDAAALAAINAPRYRPASLADIKGVLLASGGLLRLDAANSLAALAAKKLLGDVHIQNLHMENPEFRGAVLPILDALASDGVMTGAERVELASLWTVPSIAEEETGAAWTIEQLAELRARLAVENAVAAGIAAARAGFNRVVARWQQSIGGTQPTAEELTTIFAGA